MAKTKVEYVIAAACCGSVAIGLLITSLATEYWITADITAPSSEEVSTVNYGLFGGTYYRKVIGNTQTYYLYPVCQDVCMWSCLDNADARYQELLELLIVGTAEFQCTSSVGTKSFLHPSRLAVRSVGLGTDNFMQNGVYRAAFTTLIVACSIATLGLCLNIYNIFANPIRVFLSLQYVPSFYFSSIGSMTTSLIVWGVEYSSHISKNVAILDTLVASYKSEASLGWSYFIIIAAALLNITAGILILVRQKIITKEQSAQTIRGDEVNNDANTFMY